MTCQVNVVVSDSKYILAPSLQQGFLDKDTGEPLAAGVVTFYRDVDHTQLKPIFTISGPPDAPIFTELPNPLTLSSIGTFQYPTNNQDIIPYYYPYDADGNIDLYYITVYSADNVLQFTRDHFPSINDISPNDISQLDNYVPDGQFLLHQDLPDNGLVNSTGNYPVAFGGWSFDLVSPNGSTNYITFPRYDAPINNPEANPRYAFAMRCTAPDPSDSTKELSLGLTDVNFLQGQDATFQLTGYSNDSGTYNVQVVLFQYFGSGGSAGVNTTIGTLVLTPAIQTFTFNFTVPTTIGKTLGALNDDVFSILFKMPLNSPYNISLVDVILVSGTFSILQYPNVSPESTKAFAIPASFETPAYDGSDEGKVPTIGLGDFNRPSFLYFPAVPTGTVLSYGGTNPPPFYLLCDGQSYAIDGYDGSGTVVAYNDLWNVIGTNFGTGINGFTNVADSMNGRLKIVWNRFDILQPAPISGTSGFTFTLLAPAVPNTAPQIYACDVLPGLSIVPGSYYILPVNTGSSQFIQLMFFAVDGVGSIPNVTHDVARRIDVSASWSINQVRDMVVGESNGLFQVPDLRGNFIRYWNSNSPTVGNGSDVYHHDSDAAIREPSGSMTSSIITVPSGSSGNSIGSYQRWQVGAPSAFGGEGYYYIGNQAGGSINSTGGQLQLEVVTNDTRGNNLYLNAIIRT